MDNALLPADLDGLDPLVLQSIRAEAARRNTSVALVIQALWRAAASRPVDDIDLAARIARNSVPSGECLFWTAGLRPSGYGYLHLTQPRRMMAQAHRIAWQLAFGPIPDGLMVLHTCDALYPPGDITYRRCIRVEHLFLGTAADNTADANAKGRLATGDRQGARRHPETRPRGAAHHHSRLTEAIVLSMRADYIAGVRIGELALRYGVSEGHVYSIIKRRLWTHI